MPFKLPNAAYGRNPPVGGHAAKKVAQSCDNGVAGWTAKGEGA